MSDLPIDRRTWLAANGLAITGLLPVPAGAAEASPPGGLIRLSLNENAFGPSPRVAPAIAAESGRLNRYVEQADADALIRQIATLERVRPDQVVLGEVLGPLGLALARSKQGGDIIFSTPGYTELVDAAAPLGGRPLPIPLDARQANDLPAIERAMSSVTIAVSLVNPHNPSGTTDDPTELAGFIERVSRKTLVIVDEAYLEYDDLERRSAVRFVRQGADVVVFRTLAKAYGLAGLSIGYALAPIPLAAELAKAGVGEPHLLNRLSLAAAKTALADQDWVRRVAALTVSERQRLTRALDRLRIRHSDSRASFVFFDAADHAQAAREALTAAGILIGKPFPPLDDWLRITVGTPDENTAVIRVLDHIFT
jgi:histidinol-phosphate aminotransferase